MNDWGIPDWTDEKAYQIEPDAWSVARWLWEFHRRHHDIRAYFDEWAQLSHAKQVDLCRQQRASLADPVREAWYGANYRELLFPEPPEIDQPGFLAFKPNGDSPFGYMRGIPNPRIGNQPENVLMWDPDLSEISVNPYKAISASNAKYLKEKLWPLIEHWTCRDRNDLEDFLAGQPLEMEVDDVAVIFDLNRPVGPQLQTAKMNLEALQLSRFDKVEKPKRHHLHKWPIYLRVLDARDAGASWSQIAEILPEDPKGKTVKTPQSARDIYKAADTLRNSFFS